MRAVVHARVRGTTPSCGSCCCPGGLSRTLGDTLERRRVSREASGEHRRRSCRGRGRQRRQPTRPREGTPPSPLRGRATPYAAGCHRPRGSWRRRTFSRRANAARTTRTRVVRITVTSHNKCPTFQQAFWEPPSLPPMRAEKAKPALRVRLSLPQPNLNRTCGTIIEQNDSHIGAHPHV
jgi:hypothetical protein